MENSQKNTPAKNITEKPKKTKNKF